MTIAVGCNLSSGVIFGVDSAISIMGEVETPTGRQVGVLKVYHDSEKLFQISQYVGAAAFGMGRFGDRSIGSFIQEFKLPFEKDNKLESKEVSDICEDVRAFFLDKYKEIIIPELEGAFKTNFNEIPPEKRPVLGYLVGGFSPHEHLSEMWKILIPVHKHKDDIINVRAKGNFGTNWEGRNDPIKRIIKGFDPGLINGLIDCFVKKSELNFDENMKKDINELLLKYEHRIPYDGMPLQEGVDHVKFLLDVVINHTKFVIGAPICGGPIRIGVITKDEGFKYVTDTTLRIRE